MDPRLLRLYTDELAHLREVGSEFAQEFPLVAERLGIETLEVADPYVERLLEGFAFLAARVQLQLEAEQPRLIAHLLESIYPNFLAPVPSMLIARFGVNPDDPNLSKGFVVPRGSAVKSELPRGQDTRCEFRTAHDVMLWPIELVDVRYFSYAPDLPLARMPQTQGVKGGLRIRLRLGGGLQWRQLALDSLRFYISAPDDVAFRLHELIGAAVQGSWIHAEPPPALADGKPDPSAPWRSGAEQRHRGPASVRSVGHANGEALLPASLRAFSGYRLLQEVAALPQRLLFFEVGQLADRLRHAPPGDLELVVLFSRGDAALEPRVDASSLALFCTPAINLFPKRLDRIQLGPDAWQYQVVPDRTRPMDFEVHSLVAVQGFGVGRVAQQTFEPLYASTHAVTDGGADATASTPHGYYTVRREPRKPSAQQRQNGPRTAYVGEELFISLVDPRHAPYREDVRQLAIQALATNRDLPRLLPAVGAPSTSDNVGSVPSVSARGSAAPAGPPIWKLDASGPVKRVDVVRGPTHPASRRPVGDIGWQLVSHLTLNHLSLIGADPQANAAALRRMLLLYGVPDDSSWQRMVEGIRRLEARSVVRRLPGSGPLCFGTGVALTLELDELAFQGASAFLFASVLEVFFARHAAINSFSQLTLKTVQRGEVMRWPPRSGSRETL